MLSKEEKSRIQSLNASKPRKCNAYKSEFMNNLDKYSSYFLGLMWADGYLNKKYGSIRFEIVKDDADDIFYLFKKLNFCHYHRKKINRKDTMYFSMTDKILYSKLKDLGYENKSGDSANLVLNYIPKNLHNYWWLGFFNGDGCFYFNEKNRTREISIGSTYDQNWDFFDDLSKNINIKYSLNRRIHNEKSKSSCVRITGRNNIENFGNYIYSDYSKEEFGFYRKKEKFQSIIGSYA